MFREESSEIPAAPRPVRKPTPWLPIVLVVLVGLGVAHVAGLTEPLKAMAQRLGLGSRPPGSRLVGDWESRDDPMFSRISYPAIKDATGGTGIFVGQDGRRECGVVYKIVSEDRSGTNLELAEFRMGLNLNYRVRYTIAKDGQTLTRDYDERDGTHISCHYRYVGPATASLPWGPPRP
jgi:hypothetical protein